MTVDLLLRRSEAREAGLQTGRDLIGTRKKREKFTFTWSSFSLPSSSSRSLFLFAPQCAGWIVSLAFYLPSEKDGSAEVIE